MSEFNEAALLEITDMLTTATENVEKVYGAGHSKGYQTGYTVGHQDGDESYYNQGYDAGKQAEYDAFWDALQEHGNRTRYSLGLCGDNWTKETFKPKYPIKPAGSMANCFAYWGGCGVAKDIDLREACILDTSNSNNFASCFFNNLAVIGIGVLDGTNVTSMAQVFNGATNLVTIEKIILGNAVYTVTDMFKNCNSLVNVLFEGEIRLDMNFQWSTLLTRASIESIVNHLSDSAEGKTLTLSKAAVDEAFKVYLGPTLEEDPNGYDNPDNWVIGSVSGEWMELCYIHSNWTITLI